MFDVLPASDTHLDVYRRWVATSLAAHALAVAAAVVLTHDALQPTKTPTLEQAMQLYVPPPAPAPPAAPESELFAPPSPEGFQTIPPLSEVPPAIPAVDFQPAAVRSPRLHGDRC